ncbi:MAG: Rrf2 family transcriptional regulator [Proteobacteria bacterium]|nr:MAG: Rrf2 family transcriptional regulator [Pseudomonadota bacterium]
MGLARPADEIAVGEIVRRTEGALQLVEFFEADNQCTIPPACTLKGIFQEALEAMFGVLDSYSVQDLVQCRTQLKKLL